MGEIGIPRRDFLYDLCFWEVRRIVNGYRRRERTLWELTRWQTFLLMHNGMADLKKAGIYRMQDLIRFPWEDGAPDDDDQPSDEEIDAIRKHLQGLNQSGKQKE